MAKRSPVRSQAAVKAPAPQPVAAEPSASPWLVWVALALLALLGAALGFRQITSPDIGFQLNAGRWIAEHGAVPRADTFLYPSLGRAYVDMQWLYQLGIWELFRAGGPFALVLGHTLLTLGSLALLVFRTLRRDGRVPWGLPVLLLFFCFGNEWEPRPHVLSWLWLSLVLLVLEEYARGSRKWVWALPFIMILWANSHALYILGLVAIGCHGLAMLYQTMRRGVATFDGQFAMAAAAACLACLATPHGLAGLLFPFKQFGLISSSSSIVNSAEYGIAEAISPLSFSKYLFQGRVVILQPVLFWQLSLVAVMAGFLAAARRTALPEWLGLVLFGYLFSLQNKNFGYFALVTFVPAAGGVSTVSRWILRSVGAHSRKALTSIGWVFTGGAAAAIVWVLGEGWYRASWSPHRTGFDFNERFMPIKAGEFLAESPPAERPLNALDHGGWLSFATGRPVFIDGRTDMISDDHYRHYLRLKDPKTLRFELNELKPEWVVVPLDTVPLWHQVLSGHAQWRRVYADEWTAIYFHKDYAVDVPKKAPPEEGTDYPQIPDASIETILRFAEERPKSRWWDSFAGESLYPTRAVRRSAFYLLGAQPQAARNWALHGLEQCPVFYADLWINLTYSFATLRDFGRAERCIAVLRRHMPGRETEMLAREIQAAARRVPARESTGSR